MQANGHASDLAGLGLPPGMPLERVRWGPVLRALADAFGTGPAGLSRVAEAADTAVSAPEPEATPDAPAPPQPEPPTTTRARVRTLDHSRPYGVIRGQPDIPGCDRVPVYDQDGAMFDANGREIVPAKPLQATQEVGQAPVRQQAATALLAHAGKLPAPVLKAMAGMVLGPGCPTRKPQVLAALKAAAKPPEPEPEEEVDERIDVGEAADEEDEHHEPINGAPAPLPAPPEQGPVSLAAWARGQKEYGFGEVRKAIEKHLNCVVTDSAAALEVLIDKGVVPFKEARTDLTPPAIEIEEEA
jgi:hypothetical protein